MHSRVNVSMMVSSRNFVPSVSRSCMKSKLQISLDSIAAVRGWRMRPLRRRFADFTRKLKPSRGKDVGDGTLRPSGHRGAPEPKCLASRSAAASTPRRYWRSAAERPRWGWRRLLILLHRDRVAVGEHRFRRIYRQLGLQVRARKKRKVRYVRGNAIAPVNAPNERWFLDFMHDTLTSGRRLRALMVIDDFTRECLPLRSNAASVADE